MGEVLLDGSAFHGLPQHDAPGRFEPELIVVFKGLSTIAQETFSAGCTSIECLITSIILGNKC